MRIEDTVTINGTSYKVIIREYSKRRNVIIKNGTTHKLLIDDRRYKEDQRTWFQKLRGKEREPFPDRCEHVGDALNEAVAKQKGKIEKAVEMREAMKPPMESAKEVWEAD